jgi:hypothetical protein
VEQQVDQQQQQQAIANDIGNDTTAGGGPLHDGLSGLLSGYASSSSSFQDDAD